LVKSKQKLLSNTPQYSFEAIGTHWTIDINQPLAKKNTISLLKKIKNRIDEFDKNYSRFRSDSLVARISQKPGVYALPSDAYRMFSLYKKIYDLTSGLVTPLIGNVLEDAGYDAKYSFFKKDLKKPFKWEDVINYKDSTLTSKKAVTLDFGAAGKGYLVDLIAELLITENIYSFCINAGGDIMSLNSKEIVGLEHPRNPNQVIGTVALNNKSICGSSGNRRKWGDFHHIISPKTLKPVNEIIAVWVIADTTILADIISTALFFVKPETLNEFAYEYLIVNSDHTFSKSPNFNGEMYN
jgi:FAD:protein FMN transferase